MAAIETPDVHRAQVIFVVEFKLFVEDVSEPTKAQIVPQCLF